MRSVDCAPLFWKINTLRGRNRGVMESKYTITIWFVCWRRQEFYMTRSFTNEREDYSPDNMLSRRFGSSVVIERTIKLRFCGKFMDNKIWGLFLVLMKIYKKKQHVSLFPYFTWQKQKNHSHMLVVEFLSGTSLSSRRRATAPARRAEKYVDLSEHAELHRLISLFHLQNVWLGSDGSELFCHAVLVLRS